MVDSQQGAQRRVGYSDLTSNKCKWNNCFIKNAQRIAIFELPSFFRWRVSSTIFVVNGIWAHIPLPVNQSKRRNCNIPLLVFNNNKLKCSRTKFAGSARALFGSCLWLNIPLRAHNTKITSIWRQSSSQMERFAAIKVSFVNFLSPWRDQNESTNTGHMLCISIRNEEGHGMR